MSHNCKKSMIYALVSFGILSASVVSAETVPGTDFNVHLESANIVGTGLSVNMHRVPVVLNSTGATVYYDVSYKLSTDSNGSLTFSNFSQVTSPSLNSADNFIPGTYVDEIGNKYQVSGGGVSNNRTIWSIASLTTGVELNANWATGIPVGNPIIDITGTNSDVKNLVSGLSYGWMATTSGIPALNVGHNITAVQAGQNIIINLFSSIAYKIQTGTLTLTPA